MRFEEPTMEIIEVNSEDIMTLNSGGEGTVDTPLSTPSV